MIFKLVIIKVNKGIIVIDEVYVLLILDFFWQDNVYAYFYYFADSLEGVPPYPLYKRFSSALLKCMDSETFCRTGANLAMTDEFEDSSMQQKRNEWHRLIVEKGFEIENVNAVLSVASLCYVLVHLLLKLVLIHCTFVSTDFEECFL